LYSSAESFVPTFGSPEDIPVFNLSGFGPLGPLMKLSVEPPRAGLTFIVPAALLIPLPSGHDSHDLSVRSYESAWILVWDNKSHSQKGGYEIGSQLRQYFTR
jgi:hypothetical protein